MVHALDFQENCEDLSCDLQDFILRVGIDAVEDQAWLFDPVFMLHVMKEVERTRFIITLDYVEFLLILQSLRASY